MLRHSVFSSLVGKGRLYIKFDQFALEETCFMSENYLAAVGLSNSAMLVSQKIIMTNLTL